MSGTTSPPPPSRRRFTPVPVETTTKTNRKFAPVPVETSHRSSNNRVGISTNDFASEQAKDPTSRRRIVIEPIETSTSSNRKIIPAPEPTPVSTPKLYNPHEPKTSENVRLVRRFKPELIESCARSKKNGSNVPATLPMDKTDITPGTDHIYARDKEARLGPAPSGIVSSRNSSIPFSEVNPRLHRRLKPQRQGSMKPHLNTRRSTRRDSFVPELESIESSESEEGDGRPDTPSLSDSMMSSEDSIMRGHMARTRESCDDRFSGYLLALAAKAAEKQLREEALSAFANSEVHQPVEHYYDREIDGQSDDGSVAVRLMSHEILDPLDHREHSGWSEKDMAVHLETLARQREDSISVQTTGATQGPFYDPFWTNGMSIKPADVQKEAELKKMRDAASPPMLGGDLKFRLCEEPEPSSFETDQEFEFHPSQNHDGGGLWKGYCVADEEDQYTSPSPYKSPALIATPAVEQEDPFSFAFSSDLPSPKKVKTPKGVQMVAGIDERLRKEAVKSKLNAAIQEEFDDSFITQVFNYLSLGYPSLARYYDEEISRITQVPEAELSKGETMTTATGHVGLIEGKSISIKEISQSPRWQALRLYIIEWAKQNPSLEDGAIGPSAWGVRARRGSWAI